MTRAIVVQWDMGHTNPVVYRVWYPLSTKGIHLSIRLYSTEEQAHAAANRWNMKHGIK